MAISSFDFDYLCKLVHDSSAIVLEPGKEYLLESRLLPLARREGFDTLNALVTNLRANSVNGMHRKVVEAMTTNETTFFRDLHPEDEEKHFGQAAAVAPTQWLPFPGRGGDDVEPR